MADEILISYARATSKEAARALKGLLRNAAFLDEKEIGAGELFPLSHI